MKVVRGSIVTRIYPFVEPRGEPKSSSPCVIIYPHAIRIVCESAMSTEAARQVAEALLYAVEEAENR